MDALDKGLVWIPGNGLSPMNYEDNTYHFRQDSSFLYYAGIDLPDLSLLIDLEEGRTYLCGDDRSSTMVIWMGPQPLISEYAERVDIGHTLSAAQLKAKITNAVSQNRTVHYLPPYRGHKIIQMAEWLERDVHAVIDGASRPLIDAVIQQRSMKEDVEIEQMEIALGYTKEMHLEVLYETKPGISESVLVGHVMMIAHKYDVELAYPAIITKNGQTLHNHLHHNILKNGQLVLGDFGAESPMHYAADITRTWPVSGTFTPQQRDIYELVLSTEMAAIDALKPGVPYRDVHLLSAKLIATGLTDLGIMKGDPDSAVEAGAHALFFPHGVGHMVGMDVHDMEDFDENIFGYDDEIKRSTQFGLSALRFGVSPKPGMVLTVEPGIYFIPELIKLWAGEQKHRDFINYDKLDSYNDFGGVRIEDNCLLTESGNRVLGPGIPKKVADVEFLMSANRS